MRAGLFIWLVSGFVSVAFAGGGSFVGTYRGEGVVMEIEEAPDGRFSGTIQNEGESARFIAREQEDALVGTLTLDDEKVPVMLTLKDATLTLTAGVETYTFFKQNASASEIPGAAVPEIRELRINDVVIDPESIRTFERDNRTRIPRGDFWYDKISGAWGVAGEPTMGFTASGMDLGGPLKEDASRGNTGVFINDRQLPLQDVIGLWNLGVPVQQGRWWVDNSGNFGVEGNPQVLGNVFQYSRGKGGSYQRATAGGYIGGDGQTSYFFDPKTGSSVMTGP
jgi:hypothetical protein